MFSTTPQAGTICVITLNETEDLTPMVATLDSSGVAYLCSDEVALTITPALEGVDLELRFFAGGHKAGDVVYIYMISYLPFEADMRICSGKNGTAVRFPTSLYSWEKPSFEAGSVWELHLNGGVIDARKAVSALDAELGASTRVERALEVIANGTY